MRVEAIKAWVQIAQGVTTTLAIVVGGYWTYLRFIRHREALPKAAIEHVVTSRNLCSGKWLLRVGVRVRNIGNVLLKWKDGFVRIQQISPCTPEYLDWIEGRLSDPNGNQTEADWPVISEKTLLNYHLEVEPGEADASYFDFIINHDVECVLVYSHVTNAKKSSIGWNHTTMHEIPGEPEGVAMPERQGPPKPTPTSPPPPLRQPTKPPPVPRPTPQGPPKPAPERPPPQPKAK